MNRLILQVDSNKALIKCHEYSDNFYELDLKTSQYRIIGTGTLYHKVNCYLGFNIMLITQLCILALAAVLIICLFNILQEILFGNGKKH